MALKKSLYSFFFRYLLEPDDPAYLTNCKNSRGHTPLYIAAKHGNLEVIKLLFKWKVNYLIPSKVNKDFF